MADVINRLKMETTQYDSKLRDAAQKLKEFGREAEKAGADFQKLSKDNMELAKSFGTIGTSATNNKDKLKELVNAYNDVAKAYNNLTQEQQQSDFGKALSQSLDQLKGRISETKQELQNVGDKMKDTSRDSNGLDGILNKLAGKFGMNVEQLGKLGIGLAATGAALKVAQDAFFASEANLDNWNRAVYASQSVYEGFLTSLNTGDISGFIGKINQIIDAAQKAYNALDTLNTQKALSAGPLSGMKTEADRFDRMLRTGVWIGDPTKSSGSLKEGQQLTPAQMKVIRKMRENLQKRIVSVQKTLVNSADDALEALYNEASLRYGMSKSDFMEGTRNLDVYKTNMQGYANYLRFEQQHRTKVRRESDFLGGGYKNEWVRDNAINPYAKYRAWGVYKDDGKLQEVITKTEQERNAMLSEVYSSYGTMYRTFERANRRMGGGGGTTRTGAGTGRGGTTTPTYVPVEGSIDAQAALVAKLQKAWRAAADDDSRLKIKEQIEAAQKELDKMQGKSSAPVGSMKYYADWLKELQDKQQEVTTNNEWEYYAGQIDFVTKKMKELRGEVEQMEMATAKGGATGNNIGSWINAQQQRLSDMEAGSAGSRAVYANIIDATTLQNVLNSALEAGFVVDSDVVEDLWDQILGGGNIPDSVWEDLETNINTQLASLGIDPIKIDVNTGNVTKGVNAMKESWQDAAKAVQAVGNAMQQIEDPAAKVMGIIGEAIANIALGFAQATAADAGKGGVFGWIAAIAAGIGTMASTISAIHNMTGYAEGGVIPGNHYSGDMQWARVNAGEVILNRAQASNIAGQLENGGLGNLHLETYISGEDLRIAVTNANKRRGRGEYAYSKK